MIKKVFICVILCCFSCLSNKKGEGDLLGLITKPSKVQNSVLEEKPRVLIAEYQFANKRAVLVFNKVDSVGLNSIFLTNRQIAPIIYAGAQYTGRHGPKTHINKKQFKQFEIYDNPKALDWFIAGKKFIGTKYRGYRLKTRSNQLVILWKLSFGELFIELEEEISWRVVNHNQVQLIREFKVKLPNNVKNLQLKILDKKYSFSAKNLVQKHFYLLDENKKGTGGEILFDGSLKSFKRNFEPREGTLSDSGWRVVNGTLRRGKGAKNLLTKKRFGDFELEFGFELRDKKLESGIFFRVDRRKKAELSALKYQLIGHKNNKSKNKNYSLASMTGLYGNETNVYATWGGDRGKIVAKGSIIRYYLNETLILMVDTKSAEFKKRKANSLFNNLSNFPLTRGFIELQGGGKKSNNMFFHYITLRKL